MEALQTDWVQLVSYLSVHFIGRGSIRRRVQTLSGRPRNDELLHPDLVYTASLQVETVTS